MSQRNLKNAVVVLTGASSGIGRATALAFAREGADLILAARHQAALDEVVAECEKLGARAAAVPTDVSDAEAVQRLASTAVTRYSGRIDIWINNAGIGAVGRFTETPVEAHDQVIRTNLMGHLHGAYAVLPYFQRQRAGTLINNISFGAWVPAPYAVAYSASKFGLRGMSEALRAELSDWPDIHVCDVFPSLIDTPGMAHAGNYTGRALGTGKTAYDPHEVAEAIISLAKRPHGAITVGTMARLARLGHFLMPSVSRWLGARATSAYLARADKVPVTNGNLFEPSLPAHGIYGPGSGPEAHRGRALVGTVVATGTALLGLALSRRR